MDADAGARALRIEPAPGAGAQAQLFVGADPGAPLVLVLPALGVPARAYRTLADSLVRHGLNALLADLRGVGSSGVRARRGRDWGYAELVDEDLGAMLQLARSQLPDAPVLLLGHSLGGHLALMRLARHGDPAVAGVVLAASGSPHWHSYPWPMRWAVRAFGATAAASSRLLGYFPGGLLRFGGPQGARLMRQWAGFVRSGALPSPWPGIDLEAALRADARPVLALHLRGDRLAPPASVAALARRLDADAQVETLPADGGRPGHFGWLRDPDEVAARVARFASDEHPMRWRPTPRPARSWHRPP